MSTKTSRLARRYEIAQRRMQSGVAADQAIKPETGKASRVGINTALSDHAALALLLIDKGVITRTEYLAAIGNEMEKEVQRYEKHLSDRVGKPVSLGPCGSD